MTDSFQELNEILQTGNIPEDTSDFSEACYQRLLDALGNSSGSGDIVSLVRHILRREDVKQGVSSQTLLKVPRKPPFPNRSIWEQFSIKVLNDNDDDEYYLINAHPWQPEWLELSEQYPPDTPVFKEENRRSYEEVAPDPFLSLVQRKSYRSVGQREAIRAVLTAPENSSLVINLPTSSGKSLCAQLPALLNSRTSGVSVVVVPTTALAIDQERALKPFVNHDTAYYGDKSQEEQERREGIRNRIRAGTQRIIFTSPESLMDSLAPALYEAAKLGMLRYFIIDEAHMVEQWGDDFRPAFQEIPGLRRDLLRLTSFTTLLLTATLTESCLDTLETLFGKPGEFQLISAVELRSEPSYWFSNCETEEVRKQRLLEAVYHLPRPLIIYATKREDVESWKRELNRSGFKRCGVMTGQSSSQERLQLIKNLREKKLDIVVATSAFGLGVDQADIRAVIHVCVPETIDRFYQEVGRGGRDGKASISLTLYTDLDLEIAKSLNENSPINIERGLERWQSMFNRKESFGNGQFRLPINTPPSSREEDIDMKNKQSTAWNIRTLTLMNRAGLIEIESAEPPQRKAFESEDLYKLAWDTYRSSRVIRIKNECHLDKSTWETDIEPIRLQRQNWSYKNLQLMKKALKAKVCISEIFAEAYTIPPRQTIKKRNGVTVVRACGGCPVCRKQRRTPFSGIMPQPLPVWHNPKFFVGEELQRLLANEKLMLIFYESLEDRSRKRRMNAVIKWFIGQGIINIIIPHNYQENLIQDRVQNSNNFIFLFEKYQPITMPHVPTLIFYALGNFFSHNCLSINHQWQAPRIILLPMDTPDPTRTDRKLINIFPGRQFKFDRFCTEIGI
ncbi:protein DpdF [Scytonema sp. NUACC26]|uniref:protein DpdF n=1 Tax=Scytonema sp. NUACC26 TaxID=3140176 RepID=UPI0034DB9147